LSEKSGQITHWGGWTSLWRKNAKKKKLGGWGPCKTPCPGLQTNDGKLKLKIVKHPWGKKFGINGQGFGWRLVYEVGGEKKTNSMAMGGKARNDKNRLP